MKKITAICALLSAVCSAALAESAGVSSAVMAAESDIVADYVDRNIIDREYNPPAPWWRGLEIGIAPVQALPMPMAALGGFVGYANKKADGFWAKRFGVRLDFAIPSNQKWTATAVRNGDVYDANVNLNVFGYGFDRNFGGVFNQDDLKFDFEGDDYNLNLDGTKGVFALNDKRIGAVLDFYPFGDTWIVGGLRFSGGYYVGELEAELLADIGTDIIMNQSGGNYFEYNVGDNANPTNIRARLGQNAKAGGRFNWKYRGPYAGLGWDIGIFRGFKLFVDAGVVFANNPQIHDNDIYIPERAIQACIVSGGDCDNWVDIDIKDPNATRDQLMSQAVKSLTSPDQNGNYTFGGQDFTTEVEAVKSQLGNDIFDDIFADIAGWLGSSNPTAARPDWLFGANGLLNQAGMTGSEFEDIVEKIEESAAGNNADFDMQKLTDEYLKARRDMVNDANDSLKSMKFIPIMRLGFMYRF
jgi:hypothetical protein